MNIHSDAVMFVTFPICVFYIHKDLLSGSYLCYPLTQPFTTTTTDTTTTSTNTATTAATATTTTTTITSTTTTTTTTTITLGKNVLQFSLVKKKWSQCMYVLWEVYEGLHQHQTISILFVAVKWFFGCFPQSLHVLVILSP